MCCGCHCRQHLLQLPVSTRVRQRTREYVSECESVSAFVCVCVCARAGDRNAEVVEGSGIVRCHQIVGYDVGCVLQSHRRCYVPEYHVDLRRVHCEYIDAL